MVVELVVGGSGCFDGEEHSPADVRLGLYEMLTALGWSFGRVIETFREQIEGSGEFARRRKGQGLDWVADKLEI